MLTFTTPESSPSGQFWGIYALLGGVRVNYQTYCRHNRTDCNSCENGRILLSWQTCLMFIGSFSSSSE